MTSYAGSHLAATGKLTGSEKRGALRILNKTVCTEPDEKLIPEIEMYIPEDIKDISKLDKLRAEVVLKLKDQLKKGPLKDCKTDEQVLNRAMEFLRIDEGKAWMRLWFQPNAAATAGSIAGSSTTIVENLGVAPDDLGHTHPEIQGSDVNATGAHLVERAPATSLSTSVYFRAMSPSTTATSPMATAVVDVSTPHGSGYTSNAQLLGEAPAEMNTAASSPVGNGSMVVSQMPTGASAPEATASTAAGASPAAVAGALAPSRSSASQHHRSHSDPGHVSYCLNCNNFHCVSYGGPFPSVAPSSPTMPSTAGMGVQRIDIKRNERLAVRIMREAMAPLNVVAWSLVVISLGQLMKGFPKF